MEGEKIYLFLILVLIVVLEILRKLPCYVNHLNVKTLQYRGVPFWFLWDWETDEKYSTSDRNVNIDKANNKTKIKRDFCFC